MRTDKGLPDQFVYRIFIAKNKLKFKYLSPPLINWPNGNPG